MTPAEMEHLDAMNDAFDAYHASLEKKKKKEEEDKDKDNAKEDDSDEADASEAAQVNKEVVDKLKNLLKQNRRMLEKDCRKWPENKRRQKCDEICTELEMMIPGFWKE